MASLRDNFDQLFQRLRYGRGISNTGDDPVYYLVFPHTKCWRSSASSRSGKPN